MAAKKYSSSYGLIVPSKSTSKDLKKQNIFNDDSEEEDGDADWLKQSLKVSLFTDFE